MKARYKDPEGGLTEAGRRHHAVIGSVLLTGAEIAIINNQSDPDAFAAYQMFRKPNNWLMGLNR